MSLPPRAVVVHRATEPTEYKPSKEGQFAPPQVARDGRVQIPHGPRRGDEVNTRRAVNRDEREADLAEGLAFARLNLAAAGTVP